MGWREGRRREGKDRRDREGESEEGRIKRRQREEWREGDMKEGEKRREDMRKGEPVFFHIRRYVGTRSNTSQRKKSFRTFLNSLSQNSKSSSVGTRTTQEGIDM